MARKKKQHTQGTGVRVYEAHNYLTIEAVELANQEQLATSGYAQTSEVKQHKKLPLEMRALGLEIKKIVEATHKHLPDPVRGEVIRESLTEILHNEHLWNIDEIDSLLAHD